MAFAELRRTVALSISLPWVREEFEHRGRMGPDFGPPASGDAVLSASSGTHAGA
jgi:hypothetical protein